MSLAAGMQLGPYEIQSLIGAGGMGEVYKALDAKLQRIVAVKVLLGEPDESSRKQLLNEARAASALSHPNICMIYEVGDVGDQAFIVMEHVEGRPLSELIPRDGLSAEAVTRYGAQIAGALAHAHRRGVVHRDLKGANVVITPEGWAKILDFGLATRLRLEKLKEVTHSHQVVPEGVGGTLPYMAPEVLRGEPADARSDIWALGVMLYKMVCGRLPFDGQTGLALTAAILREPPAPLPARVSAGLRTIIRRCLSKEPGGRPQSAADVQVALEHVGGKPIPHAAPWRVPSSRRSRSRIRSISVLPLENLSRDPEQDYFADGMTEALITDLAQIGALRVISRTSAMRYKRSDKSIPEIASELGVDAVVEGSVLRAGDQVRITAQLIDGPTDTHLWARSYDRDLRDILKLQGEVARAIAHEIQLELKPHELRHLLAARPVNTGAHEAYLKGRYYWNKRTVQDFKKAVEFFQQAIDRDPTYPLAYAGLADCYALLGGPAYAGEREREVMPRAKAAALKALEIDNTLAQAHAALAYVTCLYDWDFTAAEREFRQAIEHNPGYATAHQWYSICLSLMGRHDEAISEAERALELDPLSLIILCGVGFRFHLARQYDRAMELYRRALEFDQNFAVAHEYLARTHQQSGSYAEAVEESLKAIAASGRTATNLMDLGMAYARLGDRSDAAKVLAELQENFGRRSSAAVQIAMVCGTLGDTSGAFELLEKAFDERSSWLTYLRVDPMFDVLRSDPRFEELLLRMNFPH